MWGCTSASARRLVVVGLCTHEEPCDPHDLCMPKGLLTTRKGRKGSNQQLQHRFRDMAWLYSTCWGRCANFFAFMVAHHAMREELTSNKHNMHSFNVEESQQRVLAMENPLLVGTTSNGTDKKFVDYITCSSRVDYNLFLPTDE